MKKTAAGLLQVAWCRPYAHQFLPNKWTFAVGSAMSPINQFWSVRPISPDCSSRADKQPDGQPSGSSSSDDPTPQRQLWCAVRAPGPNSWRAAEQGRAEIRCGIGEGAQGVRRLALCV